MEELRVLDRIVDQRSGIYCGPLEIDIGDNRLYVIYRGRTIWPEKSKEKTRMVFETVCFKDRGQMLKAFDEQHDRLNWIETDTEKIYGFNASDFLKAKIHARA